MIPTNNRDIADLWLGEYQKGGIPSSFRLGPSGFLISALDLLSRVNFCGLQAIDLGCGTGRNSLELARIGYDVCSIDIVPEAIDALKTEAHRRGFANKIQPHCQSIAGHWPLDAASCGLAVDTFCFKHLISPEDRNIYFQELVRVLKRGGFYVLTLAGVDDGYYGPLLRDSPDPDRNVIIDPANGIASILYSREDIERSFGSIFRTWHYEHKVKHGLMHGQTFLRSTHCFIFQCADAD